MVCQNCGSESHRKNNRKCPNYSTYLKELGERKSQKAKKDELMEVENQNTSKKRHHQRELPENPSKISNSVFGARLRNLSETYLTKKIPRTSSDSESGKNEEVNEKKNSSEMKEKNPEMSQMGGTEKQSGQVEKTSESWNDYLDRMHEIDMKILAENKEPVGDDWYMKFLDDDDKNTYNSEPVDYEWYMKFLDEK